MPQQLICKPCQIKTDYYPTPHTNHLITKDKLRGINYFQKTMKGLLSI